MKFHIDSTLGILPSFDMCWYLLKKRIISLNGCLLSLPSLTILSIVMSMAILSLSMHFQFNMEKRNKKCTKLTVAALVNNLEYNY